MFEGIAPPSAEVASGDLIEGEVYQVWSAGGSGTIDYSSTTYNPITSAGSSGGEMAGTFFTATSVKTFTASGDAKVRVRNGIRSVPIKDNRDDRFRGQTNEWTTQQTTTVYKLSDSSIYKADAYGDIMGFLTDRCGLLSCDWSRMNCTTGFADRREVNQQVNYGSKMSLRPENPSGYRYVLGSQVPSAYNTNSMVQAENLASAGEGDKRHYESCQIYKPDNGIEAVYIDPTSYYAGSDYDVIVKLTGRLENETSKPTVTNSSTGWYAAFTGSYVPKRRTDENAVLEYLYHIASYGSGSITDYNCIQKIGDVAYDASTSSGYWGNDFHGNCYPRFYFSKAVRHVWNDTNASYDAADSLTTVDEMLYMEFILQAISSGFIDKESTLQFSCTDENRLYDYTFPNLCYQALKMTKSEVPSEAVTRATDTFTWDADPNALYSLMGVDGSGNETLFASSATSPHTQTGVATFTSYKAYAGSSNKENRTIIDFTLTYTGANNDNVITFSEDSAANVRYYLMGRTRTSDNSNPWLYYTGSGWSASESSAEDVSSPTTIVAANVKDEYRVEALVFGRKRWFEFLPATLRPDNAQGFGPMPNTNLYARIFNNLCNAVNLLVRARIDLPMQLQVRQKGIQFWVEDTGEELLNLWDDPSGVEAPFDLGCSTGVVRTASAYGDGSLADNRGVKVKGFASGSYNEGDKPVNVPDGDDDVWGDGSTVLASANVDIAYLTSQCDVGCLCTGTYISGTNHVTIESNRTNAQIKVKEENIQYALPVGIRTQFLNNPGVIAELHHQLQWVKKDSAGTAPTCDSLSMTADKYDSYTEDLYECVILDGETELNINPKDSPLYGAFTQEMDFYYEQTTASGSGELVVCGNGGFLDVQFSAYENKPQFIKIPVVSADYPNNTY